MARPEPVNTKGYYYGWPLNVNNEKIFLGVFGVNEDPELNLGYKIPYCDIKRDGQIIDTFRCNPNNDNQKNFNKDRLEQIATERLIKKLGWRLNSKPQQSPSAR